MLVWRAGWLKDQGKPNTLETSIAKLHATEASLECANMAIQVHGGAGYVDDHPVERYFRDARVTTLYEGTSQIQKLIIGRADDGHQRAGPRLSAPMAAMARPRAQARPRTGAAGAARRRVIGVLGAGTMGAGIAQLAAARARRRCCTTRSRRRSSRGVERVADGLRQGSRRKAGCSARGRAGGGRAPAAGRRARRARADASS